MLTWENLLIVCHFFACPRPNGFSRAGKKITPEFRFALRDLRQKRTPTKPARMTGRTGLQPFCRMVP
jgi:hypothetical protein